MKDQGNVSKRQMIYQRYEERCAYCGKKLRYEDMTLDHLTPQSKGGKSVPDNLLLSCRKCNSEKGALLLEEYRKEKVWQSLTLADISKTWQHYEQFIKAFEEKERAFKFYFERAKPQKKKSKGKKNNNTKGNIKAPSHSNHGKVREMNSKGYYNRQTGS